MTATVRGVLLDVDGTLLLGDRAIPGAPEALERLRQHGVPFRLVTNTTRRPRRAVHDALIRAGFRVDVDEILAPSVLACRKILASGDPTAVLLVPEVSREDFPGVVDEHERPGWVVVGDLGEEFTWVRLNDAFRRLRAGAKLLALQKNRFWRSGEEREVVLDAGPFVAALEYAAGVEAEVVGKPSRQFFRLAVSDLSLEPGRVLMVGDDAEADCVGGAAAGCHTALVRTGKFSEELVSRAGARPDRILDSVAELEV